MGIFNAPNDHWLHLTYAAEQRDKLSVEGNASTENMSGGTPPPEDYMDDTQRSLDEKTIMVIEQLLAEYQDDMQNFEAIQKGALFKLQPSMYLKKFCQNFF